MRFNNNGNLQRVKKLKMRIPVSIRPGKIINPKKEYNKRENRTVIEEELLIYEYEKEEEKITELNIMLGDD